MKGLYNPISILKTNKWKKQNKDIDHYRWNGTEIFMGAQGKGKTLSACKTLIERLEEYPEAIFISNTIIKGITNKSYYFNNTDELVNLLRTKIELGNRKGYVIFIDEIHVVLAELFGRTDPIFLQFLSQQRKMNINIIGTSQMYNKLPRVIRDYLRQSGQIIECTNWFKLIQINKRLNMENVEEDSKNNLRWQGCRIEIFFHTPELYQCYDTFAVISQIQGLMEKDLRKIGDEGIDRYGNDNRTTSDDN